jgi:nucleotide-binding universal stress UspA family protein
MRVLLAIDGSPHSDAAVAEVRRRSWPYGTVVEILTVIRTPAALMIDAALVMAAVHLEQLEEQRCRASVLLNAAADQIDGEAMGLTVTTKILEGNAKDMIVEEALEWGADLIVVGSHGYGRLRRLVLGSVAGAVVANAPCSVQVVRDRHAIDRSLSKIHRVVVPVGESESQRKSLRRLHSQRIDQLLTKEAHRRRAQDYDSLFVQPNDTLIGPKIEHFGEMQIFVLRGCVATGLWLHDRSILNSFALLSRCQNWRGMHAFENDDAKSSRD